MMIINKQSRFLPLQLLLAGACCSSLTQARAVLEEVIVTAQHRAQSLQDVPVSVTAMSGDKMLEAGINRMEDLQAYVPNLTVTESGISTDIFIRGIGTGINQGFEQSVGMYVDGIYYGRAQLARAPFLDLARAEVLRGPQNILHGKNSIAGAVNLHTADPTEEFEGMVSGLYEPNFDEQVFDLVLSGPITDKLGARFSARLRDYGGYVENLTLDRFGPQYDQATYRLKFKWDVNDDTVASLKLESGSFDTLGRQGEIISDLPSTSSTTTIFFLMLTPFYIGLVRREKGQLFNLKGWWEVTVYLWGPRGALLRAVPDWLDFFKPGFHPWDHDNREFLTEIDGLVAEVEGYKVQGAAA